MTKKGGTSRGSSRQRKPDYLSQAIDAYKAEDWKIALHAASKVLVTDPEQADAVTILADSKKNLLESKLENSRSEKSALENTAEILESVTFADSDPADALYYSVSGGDVMTSWCNPVKSPWYCHGYSFKFGLGEYGGPFYAGIHLPHGARVWGLRAYARRNVNANHDTSINISFREYNIFAHQTRYIVPNLTATFQPGSTFELKELAETSLDYLIDNRSNYYFLDVSTSGNGGSQRCWFHGAVIIYKSI